MSAQPDKPAFGDVSSRNKFTAPTIAWLCPWNNKNHVYSMGQLYLAYSPVSKLELVDLINLLNISYDSFFHSYTECPSKYNPKIYLGVLKSISVNWQYDSTTPNLSWPEN